MEHVGWRSGIRISGDSSSICAPVSAAIGVENFDSKRRVGERQAILLPRLLPRRLPPQREGSREFPR